MRSMLWGGIMAGYQAVMALAQVTQGLLSPQNAPRDDQDFTEDEIDNYHETAAGEQQALLRENMSYNLVKGLLFGYNAYRLITHEPDVISFGVGCVAAVETLQEVYETATRNERATPAVRRR